MSSFVLEGRKTRDDRQIVAMVGLPARGKTYISARLSRYLNWIGINTKVFKKEQDLYEENFIEPNRVEETKTFLESSNLKARRTRDAWRNMTLNEIMRWFNHQQGAVAIYHGVNIERNARDQLLEFATLKKVKIFFIESECTDADVIDWVVKQAAIHGDWIYMEHALRDLNLLISRYSEIYEPFDLENEQDQKHTFIKVKDVGKGYIIHNIKNDLQARIVYFLMNIKVRKSAIYLSLHGESMMNIEKRIGGDSDLSSSGILFAKRLGRFMETEQGETQVWTSELKRTQQTATAAGLKFEAWKSLNDVDPGDYDGMSYDEIADKYPGQTEIRNKNKYTYRYPMGESYQDLVTRLEPVIMALERSENVLVICHQAVIRCLLAYFQNEAPEVMPHLNVPWNTVIKLTQHTLSCDIQHHTLLED